MESPGYYEAIAKHYDEIFPMNPTTLSFLKELAGPVPSEVLDVACGNASYTVALTKLGHHLAGVDLDEGMLLAAAEKCRQQGISDRVVLLQGDMLALDVLALPPPDFAYCIGNSLVHLPGAAKVSTFLRQMHGLLKPGGRLAIQILNYHRIWKGQITSLPVIRKPDGSVLFERLYEYDLPQSPGESSTTGAPTHLLFHTRLHADERVQESRIPLYPLLADEVQALLMESGFGNIQLFGDFAGGPYLPEASYQLVVTAVR